MTTRHFYDDDTHKVVPKDAVVLEFPRDLNLAPDPTTLVHDIRNVAALEARHHACEENPALGWLADEIARQTKPRIVEPDLWGVVEASHKRETAGGVRDKWVRTPGGWMNAVTGLTSLSWDELIDPSEVREGVKS